MKKFIRSAPAYQIYPSNIMSNINFRTMSLEERGLWITLQFECWVNETVPSNPSILAKMILCREGNLSHLITPELMSFFAEEDGKIVCPELLAYKEALNERRARQSEGGKKGQQIKKNNETLLTDSDEEFENTPKEYLEGQPVSQPTGYLKGSLEQNRIKENNINEHKLDQNSLNEYTRVVEDSYDEFIQTVNNTSKYI